MDISLLILVSMLSVIMVAAFWKGGWQLVISGLKQTGLTFKSMWFRILLGMTLGGLIQEVIPGDLIARWLGPASGLKGILIGSYVFILGAGPPFVILPVIASIRDAGAGVGPIIALLTGGMVRIQGLITYGIPFLGAKLALTRYVVCFFLPPLIGLTGAGVYQLLNLD